MLHQWFILLLAMAKYGVTSENVDKIKLCEDNILTLSFNPVVQHRRAVIYSDPFPEHMKMTCNIRVNFDAAATVNLTLTTVNIWTLNTSRIAHGYTLEKLNGEKKFVPSKSVGDGQWTNTTSRTCHYLYMWRASAPNTGDTAQPIFNASTTLNATGIVIELRDIPHTTWCDVRISINASPMPDGYCQAKDQLYCNSSAQCLNATLRCNGIPDCDDGEDEANCSEDGLTENFVAGGMAVYLLAALGIVVLVMIAVLAVLGRRWHKRLRTKNDSYDSSHNHQTGASVTKSRKGSFLVNNDMYEPSLLLRPESLKESAAEPIYYKLESQCDRASVIYA